MALWWVTEAVPMAVTALLPIVFFPLTGALDIGSTTSAYGDKYVFLYLGGFLVAIAIEKWNLHKRIALSIIKLIGTDVKFIILGFMVATAFLSMWISNTATSVMMLPIGTAIISQLKERPLLPMLMKTSPIKKQSKSQKRNQKRITKILLKIYDFHL